METVNMEARKVSFAKKEYDAFDKLIHLYQSDDPNLVYRIIDGGFTNDLAPLNDVDLHKLLQAYYFGYKVYLTPLEKIQQEIDSIIEGHLPMNPEVIVDTVRDINYYLRGLEAAREFLTGDSSLPEPAPKAQAPSIVHKHTIASTFSNPGPLFHADLVAVNMEDGTYDIIKNKYTIHKGIESETRYQTLIEQAHSPIVLSINLLAKNIEGRAIYQ